MSLIGLCATKQSGKDTFADYLCENYGYVKYSFAGPLKKICAELFMLTDAQLNSKQKDRYDYRWKVTPRTLFQKIGSEIFRDTLPNVIPELNIKNNFWVRRFELWYHNYMNENPDGKIVVSDVRFTNEFNSIKNFNGVIIKINRDIKLYDEHVSEQNLKTISGDFEIENNLTLNRYYKNINELMKKV